MNIELNGTGDESFGSRARKLLAEGTVSEAEELVWTRGGVPVGTRSFTAARWANTQVVESQDGALPRSRPIDPTLPYVRV